jgi:hypothetical protein
MTSHKVVAALLLLIGLFSAFDLADYLYPEEANANVTYLNFTSGGNAFSIIKLDGVETFLLKDGEPVNNRSEIESIIYTYYVRAYYPNETSISGLRELIKRFNDSRNDGYDFKNKEEYVCRDDILLSNGKITVSGKPVRCLDNASCLNNAMLLFSVYGQGLGLGSPTVIIGPLTNFTPSSIAMDSLLANYTAKLDAMNDSNVAETISYIRDTAPNLKNWSMAVETTLFRTPRLNDSADRKDCQLRCWAICPSFDLDQKAVDELKALASSLSDRLAPLGSYQGVSASIYDRTVMRMEFLRKENLEKYYLDAFTPLNRSGAQAITDAEAALGHVQNRTVATRLDKLKSLHATIPEDISSHNFTNLDRDIGEYTNLTGEIQASTITLMGGYNSALEAKNLENSLLVVLESKDLDPVSARTLDLVNNQSSDLNAQFRDGLTLSQFDALRLNYTNLTSVEQGLLKSESDTPATRVLQLFRGFARKVNTGIAKAADRTGAIERTEIPESPAMLGLFSLAMFLSFSSLALLVFLFIFSVGRFTVPKTAHILLAAFLCVIVLLFVFSLMTYLFLGKTSTDATLPEFISDLDTRGAATIVVDVRNASFSDANAMRACASQLAESLGSLNKSWSIYTMTPNTCTRTDSAGVNSTLEASGCAENITQDGSVFVLGYSEKTEPPKFEVIYRNRAQINANLDYYQSCPLSALIS